MSSTTSYAAAAAGGGTAEPHPPSNGINKAQQPPSPIQANHRIPKAHTNGPHSPNSTTPTPTPAPTPSQPNPYHTPRTSSPESSVYIVTLSTTASISEPLANLRSTYFPSHLNKTPAHITLFHALPHSRFAVFDAVIAALARRKHPYAISTGRPRRMRKGVLVLLRKGDKESQAIRAELLDEFLRAEDDEAEQGAGQGHADQEPAPGAQTHASGGSERGAATADEPKGWLSDQDRKSTGWNAHWTVMNKVDDDEKVRDALTAVTERLAQAPETGLVEGLLLWRYLAGGRWEPVKEYRFAGGGHADSR